MLNMENIRWGSLYWSFSIFLIAAGCGDKGDPNACAPIQAAQLKTSLLAEEGAALVFVPDPISTSGNITLTPKSTKLDNFRTSVTLSHLTGRGILQGKYVEVVNGLNCYQRFGAYDPKQNFTYSHSDWRFQEAMAYYFGDIYQNFIDQAGYLRNTFPVRVVAHCELADNAYFTRGYDSNGNIIGIVCLGDSEATPGASYSDDGMVTVHELQHAASAENYSLSAELNQFWYDEAGSLNEAISDFMGLLFVSPMISAQVPLDPRIFSRWALGTFFPGSNRIRGAHRCPIYDSQFPSCDFFPSFAAPTLEFPNQSSVSYVYPDGMGWPFSKNVSGSPPISQTFMHFMGQEEIHNAGVLMTGALWDVFQALQNNHSSDNPETLGQSMSRLILESLRHLPQPNRSTHHSPVTYLGFAANLVNYTSQIAGLTSADQISVATVLKSRGLYDAPTLKDSAWIQIGSGTNWMIRSTPTPGIFVQDDPNVVIPWLTQMGADPSLVKQGLETGLNSRLDPGEVAAVWFDLQNQSSLTAGGVLLTITSDDSDLEILGPTVNIGYLTQSGLNQTQVSYQKVNGTSIVAAMNPPGAIDIIPVGNSYFRTNPFFNQSWRTAIWLRVGQNAPHGKVVNLHVSALPSNGIVSRQDFPVTIF